MKKLLFLLLVSCSVFFVNCKSNTPKKTETNIMSKEVKPLTLLDIIKIPTNFISKFEIVSTEDISYKEKDILIKRIQQKITLPSNLSEDEVKDNLRKVAVGIYNQYECKNISIFAYSDKNNINCAYTIAMYEFCPYGDWSLTNKEVSITEYKENVEIRDYYLKPIEEIKLALKIGDTVTLKCIDKWDVKTQQFILDNTIQISKDSSSFMDDNIITRVKGGTIATLLKKYEYKFSDGSLWVAYQVKIKSPKSIVGWIVDTNISEKK